MGKYAAHTEVSASESRDEIERTLTRYGATGFMYGWEGNRALVQFQMPIDGGVRHVRFVLEMPNKNDRQITHHSRGKRTPSAAHKAWEQATRQRWRALTLIIKAKLETVECGISEFEHEFMANIVMPDNRTISEHITPMIAEAYATGNMPRLLPMTT